VGIEARDSLTSKDFLKSYSISTFEGRVNYLDLTEKGDKVLQEMGYIITRKREGGPEHEYWKLRIAEHLRKNGYETKIECPLGEGKTVDIVASRDGQNIAIEIETGKSNAVENVLKNLNKEFSIIIVVPLNAKARAEILERTKRLSIYDSHKTEVLELKELFQVFPGLCHRLGRSRLDH